jgi:hypothetical protein
MLKRVDSSLGMFLWVRLVIDALEYQNSARDLIKSVNRLPEGLEGAYVSETCTLHIQVS